MKDVILLVDSSRPAEAQVSFYMKQQMSPSDLNADITATYIIKVSFSFLLFQCHFCHAQDISIMFDVFF